MRHSVVGWPPAESCYHRLRGRANRGKRHTSRDGQGALWRSSTGDNRPPFEATSPHRLRATVWVALGPAVPCAAHGTIARLAAHNVRFRVARSSRSLPLRPSPAPPRCGAAPRPAATRWCSSRSCSWADHSVPNAASVQVQRPRLASPRANPTQRRQRGSEIASAASRRG
jgi:hypothetical protein